MATLESYFLTFGDGVVGAVIFAECFGFFLFLMMDKLMEYIVGYSIFLF